MIENAATDICTFEKKRHLACADKERGAFFHRAIFVAKISRET